MVADGDAVDLARQTAVLYIGHVSLRPVRELEARMVPAAA
jgi:hypothetical protein